MKEKIRKSNLQFLGLQLVVAIVLTAIFSLNSVVNAAVATSAEAYCTATVGSTGTTVWQNCVENKKAELAVCEQDPQPASRQACRENALTYGEPIAQSEEDPGELFTNPHLGLETDAECGDGEEAIPISIDVNCASGVNPILGYLAGIINFLAAGVGIVVAIMITAAGVEYITARGAPQKVEDAKRRITNAIIALVTFIFMYAILQWLIPGGIF